MNSRKQSLDVLRGVAVLMVIVNHYAIVVPHGERTMLDIGGAGVDLFFVLSGFLISGLLFAEFKATGKLDVKRFWIRRGFKIYPSFYALMGATAMLALVRAHRIPPQLLTESVFLQNYFSRFWPHTWSLAVEEHFYFSLPLLLLVLAAIGKGKDNPFRALPAISVALSGLCLYLRIVAVRHGADWSGVAFPTHLRIDALFAGVTLGYFFHFDHESFVEARRWWVLATGVAFASAFLFLPDVPRLTVAYIAFSFIVAWTVTRNPSKRLPVRSLAWIGRYSYSIYLWHGFAIFALERMAPRWFRFPAYVLGAIVIGTTMSKLIELPPLRVRDRLFCAVPQSRNCLPVASQGSSAAVLESS